MKTWFTSLDGVLTLSALAFLSFLGRTFLDYQYVMGDFFPSPAQAGAGIVVYVLLLGGWLWGLLAAARGSRRGWIAALGFTLLLPIGAGISTPLAWCPSPCPTAGGLMEVANWGNLVLGVLAAAATGLHLRRGPRPVERQEAASAG